MTVCKFCGQLIMADAPEGATEEQELEIGTMHCNCEKAIMYRERINAVERAKDKVDEIVHMVDVNHNIVGLDDATVDRFKQCMELLIDGKTKSVSFTFDDNVGEITATRNEMNDVKVVRMLKIKEAI